MSLRSVVVLFLLFSNVAFAVFEKAKQELGLSAQDIQIFTQADLLEDDVLQSSREGKRTLVEIRNAAQTKIVHDEVEIAAYAALVEGVEALQIRSDQVSPETSRKLLHQFVRSAAHKTMRSSGGYIEVRDTKLDYEQILHLLANVGQIVHERDALLTNASYTSLVELIYQLDFHNDNVKAILLKSWFGIEVSCLAQHLDKVKSRIDFYQKLNSMVGFDVKAALANRKLK